MKNIVLLGLQATSNLGDRLVCECTKRIVKSIFEKNGISDIKLISYDMLGDEYYSYISGKKSRDAQIKIQYPIEEEAKLKIEEEKERFMWDYDKAARDDLSASRESDRVRWRIGDNEDLTIGICKRKIWKSLLLSVVTFGVYFFCWLYLLIGNTKAVKNDRSERIGELLRLIFVPFYLPYWMYTRERSVKDAFAAQGYPSSGSETACLFLAAFGLGPVAAAIMQNEFNSLPSASISGPHILTDEEKQAIIDAEVEARTNIYKENAKIERKEKLVESARNGADKIINGDTVAIIFFGGGIIKYGHSLMLGYCMEPYIRRADELGIPVMISAAGVDGYDPDNDECRVFSEILNLPCIKTVTVRDDLELLKNSYIKSSKIRIEKVPCPTLLCSELMPMGTLKEEKTIGLGVIKPDKMTEIHPGFTEKKQIALWKDIVSGIEARGFRWKFFTNGIPAEYDFAKKILRSMKIPASEDTLLPAPKSLHQLLDSLNLFEGIIASRFHAALPSYSYNIPFVELIWNIKQIHFAKDMHLEDRFFDPEKVSASAIVERLFEVMNAPQPEMPVDPQKTAHELERFLKSVING